MSEEQSANVLSQGGQAAEETYYRLIQFLSADTSHPNDGRARINQVAMLESADTAASRTRCPG